MLSDPAGYAAVEAELDEEEGLVAKELQYIKLMRDREKRKI